MRLHEAAERKWRNRCPCCDRVMSQHPPKKGRPTPSTHKTRGHVASVARGNDPRHWFWQCHKCNNEMGWLSISAWARMLILANDPRAELVAAMAQFFHDWRRGRRAA